jgi:hypothetical protein
MNEEEKRIEFGQRCAALHTILNIIGESEISNRVWCGVFCKKMVELVKQEDSPKKAMIQIMDVLAREFYEVFGEDPWSM